MKPRARRYKVSAQWVDKGSRYWYSQAEIGMGYTLGQALRAWLWLLVHKRTVAKITRKRPSRLYFGGQPVIPPRLTEEGDS